MPDSGCAAALDISLAAGLVGEGNVPGQAMQFDRHHCGISIAGCLPWIAAA